MSKTRLITLIIMAIGLLLPGLLWADLTDGLVGYWSFNNCDATDDSGNGHDGTLYGNPQCIDGINGKAFSFDGVDDYIEVPNSESLNPSAVSFSAWFLTRSVEEPGGCKWQTLIFKKNSNYTEFESYAAGGGPKMCATTSSVSHNQVSVCSQPLQANTWYHIAVTITSEEIRLYLNGSLNETKPTGFPIDHGDRPLFFGYTGESNCGGYFNGLMDEVRIYNRALSEAEIQELYGSGSFKLPDTGQTSCYDSSGHVIT